MTSKKTRTVAAAAKRAPAPETPPLNSPQLYINRELSLLAFQLRVLDEAQDERNPLLERCLLYTSSLGTRRIPTAAQLSVQVDQNPVQVLSVALAGEDVLVRWDLGSMSGETQHTVTVTHTGVEGSSFYFDFLEIAIPTSDLPTFVSDSQTTLATDWDTLNSQALAPERTAWQIQALGFAGRGNHYVGCLLYTSTAAFSLYELDDTATQGLYQAARQQTPVSVMFQLGQQTGQVVGVYMMSVVPAVPEFDDSDNLLQWKFQGSKAQGTTNNEIVVAFG